MSWRAGPVIAIGRRRAKVSRVWSRVVIGLGAVLMASCDVVYPSQVLVVFDAGPETRAEAVELRYEARNSDGAVARQGTGSLLLDSSETAFRWPSPPLPILPEEEDWRRTFAFEVELLRATDAGDPEVFHVQRFFGTFPRQGRAEYEVFFSDDCRDVSRTCRADQTCREGECVPAPFLVPPRAEPRGLDSRVASVAALRDAAANARPGDVITIAPGDYTVDAPIRCLRSGAPDAPIVVRAEPGTVALDLVAQDQMFDVTGAWWVFEGLDVRGACAIDEDCEHAFHVSRNADQVVIRDNRITDFDQAIKVNGVLDGEAQLFPDGLLVEGNDVGLSRPRQSVNPTMGIWLSGGTGHVLRGNHVHDVGTGTGGQPPSPQIWLAGNGRDLEVVGNLVDCGEGADDREGIGSRETVPLQEGLCVDFVCQPTQQRLLLADNVVVGCGEADGLRLRECRQCQVDHLSVIGSGLTFDGGSGRVSATVLEGELVQANGPVLELAENRTGGDASWWADVAGGDYRPAASLAASASAAARDEDLCGHPRPSPSAVGALEPDSPCSGRPPGLR